MGTPLIEFTDVKKSFGHNRVLDGVNLSIYRGEITAIIGKSGCGKSVLLKHIIGLMAQDGGKILIDGKPLSAMDRAGKKGFKAGLSYMFQDNALFDSMTVFENIALPLAEKSLLSRDEIQKRVDDRMAQLEILDTGKKYPSQLSGGMKKRVALARALVTNPQVVLFDEPTTGLDPIRKRAVHAMIAEYQKRFGFTAVVVSHEIPEIFTIAQRVAMLAERKIVFQGSIRELKACEIPGVREFVDARDDI